jgi:hypothetical protein
VCLEIALEVIRDQVVIAMISDCRDHAGEVLCIPEGALLDGFEHLDKFRVKGMLAIVVCVAEILDVLGKVSKEEDVVLTNLTGDFDLPQLVFHHE